MKRRLSNWLNTYLEYTRTSEAPDKFHFWTGISVVAGALRRKIWIDMGHFQWTPNFYIVFVAPPGIVSKTTTANIGMNLLREIPEVAFGPESVTWQSLVNSLASSTQTFPYDGMLWPMSPVTIVSGEFGTFLDPSDREMVDILVSLWDGQVGTFHKATKTQGNDAIENPWVNILACTTPAWIAGNFPDYLIGGGFTSRTIFVYAEQKRQYVAYPGLHMDPEDKQRKLDLIHDLEIIASDLIGEYELTPDARAWGEQWYERLYTDRPVHLDNDRFAGYLARKQTHLHKLALVLTAMTSDEPAVTKDTLIQADGILKGVESDMPLVFAQIGRNPLSLIMDEMASYIDSIGIISSELLYRKFYTRLGSRDYLEAIEGLVRMGRVKQLTKATGVDYASMKLLKEQQSEAQDAS